MSYTPHGLRVESSVQEQEDTTAVACSPSLVHGKSTLNSMKATFFDPIIQHPRFQNPPNLLFQPSGSV
jgi:hypothetical protein